MKKQFPLKKLFLPAAFLCAGGFFSLLKGQDAMWDLLNYHLYNPFAFLEGRFMRDVVPAAIHTFFNPLPDLPLYLFVKYLNDFPRLIAFMQGMWFGLYAYFLWLICRMVFPGKNKGPAMCALALGASGAAAVSQIGVSSNELMLASLCAASLYLLLKYIKDGGNALIALGAGLLSGAAAGLKYTAAPFAVAGLVTLALFWLKNQKKKGAGVLWFGAGAAAGFLVCNGYFMWRLWHHFGNPFFPFFNEYFHSSYFDPAGWSEGRFYPSGVWQWLFYPFYWLAPRAAGPSEIAFADPRGAVGLAAAFILFVSWFWRPKRRNAAADKNLLPALMAFCFVSYVWWLYFFSILRYAVLLEGLCAVLCVAALGALLPSAKKVTAAALCVLLISAWGTSYPDWRHVPFGRQAVQFDRLPEPEPNALVLTDGAPLAFAAAFIYPRPAAYASLMPLNPDDYPPSLQARAARRNVLPASYYAYRFETQIDRLLQTHKGPVYLLALPWPGMFEHPVLRRAGLDGDEKDCARFNANVNLYSQGFALCPLKPAAPGARAKTPKKRSGPKTQPRHIFK